MRTLLAMYWFFKQKTSWLKTSLSCHQLHSVLINIT